MYLPAEIELLTNLKVSKADREAFRNGPLRESWAKLYPELFDELNLQTARNQPDNHFYEWHAARHLYLSTGYLSLVGKYEFKYQGKKHTARRHDIFTRVIPSNLHDFVMSVGTHAYSSAPPDLFVYKEQNGQFDWFFCEVKGVTDTLQITQVAFFTALAQHSGKSVRLITYEFA